MNIIFFLIEDWLILIPLSFSTLKNQSLLGVIPSAKLTTFWNRSERTCYYTSICIEQTTTTVWEENSIKTESSIWKTDVYCRHSSFYKKNTNCSPFTSVSSLEYFLLSTLFILLVAHKIQRIKINKNSHKKDI